MKIKSKKNELNHEIVDCPFCDYWTYVRRGSNDPLNGLKRHITNASKNEALQLILNNETIDTLNNVAVLHLDYYKKHTSEKKIVRTDSRHFDDDMELQ